VVGKLGEDRMGKIKDVTEEVWAGAAVAVTSPVALAAGVVNGARYAVTGKGGFLEGADEATDAVAGTAERFARQHSGALTDAAIKVAGEAAAKKIGRHE
jgi:hypothetical protein